MQYIAAYEGAVQARIVNEHQERNPLGTNAQNVEIPSTPAGFEMAGLGEFVSFSKV